MEKEKVNVNMKEVITITFGDAAQNHPGMEQLGTRHHKGFSFVNMSHAQQYFEKKGYKAQLIALHQLVSEQQLPNGLTCDPAYILVVKNGLNCMLEEGYKMEDLHKELTSFEWDAKYFDTRRQKVLNKHARRNVCFGEKAQQPDYQNKKGTIVPWEDVPLLQGIRQKLNQMMGTTVEFQAQGNLYHDGGVKNTGLGYHGDSERRMVIAIRTGNNTMPLHYQWFHQSKSIGKNFSVDIAPGDLYVMSQKAVGTDWLKKSIMTIRHASGAAKFVKI